MQVSYTVKDRHEDKEYKFNKLNQLLYWCHLCMGNYNKGLLGYSSGIYEYYTILNFFKQIAHNKNDGNIKYEAISEKYFDEISGHLETRYISLPPKFVRKRYIIHDSFGRIVNSAWLKTQFLKYTPDEQDRVINYKVKYNSWINYTKLRKQFKFRKGPVPCIHKYRNGHWHHINHTNHGFLGYECRKTLGLKAEQKDILEEFGVSVKFRNKRSSVVKSRYIDYDRNRSYKKSIGWKRSKNKLKQWM